MDDHTTSTAQLAEWRERIEQFDKMFRPFKRTLRKAAAAGVEEEFTFFVDELIAGCTRLAPEQRQHLIDLLHENKSCRDCMWLQRDFGTLEELRRQMIVFVLRDQDQDPRDAIGTLTTYEERALRLGLDMEPVLREMAQLASSRSRFEGWRSTRDMILQRVRSY